jgi:TetR/AcrR family transcriptional regulator, transcriptional repressor for nem operon
MTQLQVLLKCQRRKCSVWPILGMMRTRIQIGSATELQFLTLPSVPSSLYKILVTRVVDMSKREEIIAATKTLLWKKGYEATSPRDIQAMSNAGQGSFYHHFPSKLALAEVAIQEVVDERINDFEEAMRSDASFNGRVSAFISHNIEPLRGCRVGRLVWDSAIEEAELRKPLEKYFRHLEQRLTEILEAETADGRMRLMMPAREIALMILTVVQGSYSVSRALNRSRLDDARSALMRFLDLAILS